MVPALMLFWCKDSILAKACYTEQEHVQEVN